MFPALIRCILFLQVHVNVLQPHWQMQNPVEWQSLREWAVSHSHLIDGLGDQIQDLILAGSELGEGSQLLGKIDCIYVHTGIVYSTI